MSSQRSTRSATSPSVGGVGGSAGGDDAERDRLVALERLGQHVVVGRRHQRQVDREPAGTRAAQQAERRTGRAGVHPRLGALVGDRLEHPGQGVRGLGRVDRAVPVEPGRRRHAAASGRRRRAGSSTCTTSALAAGAGGGVRRATCPRSPSASAWASSRRAPMVAEHLVAARLLDGRGEGPRPGDLDLERARCSSWACSSSASRSWASRLRARRWSTPGASVSRHPAGWRSAPRSLDHGQRPPGHARRVAPRPGSSGRCGRSGSSPSTIRTASAYAWSSSPGIEPDPGRDHVMRSRQPRRTRSVAAMVADPTTRVPS